MGAASDKHLSIPERESRGRSGGPQFTEPMDTSESPKISLVTTGQKAPAWHRSVFNLDFGFRGLLLLAALIVLGIVALIVIELMQRSLLAWQKFGLHFFFGSEWNPVAGSFGALPFIYGTLVSSLIALVIAVPLAVAVAVFVTEMCPRPLRKPISYATELLAAIPSVIYGLWAIFILVPILRVHVDPWLIHYLAWTGLFTGPAYGLGMLAAGTVMAS
jgi:phosphate transport system permease protein